MSNSTSSTSGRNARGSPHNESTESDSRPKRAPRARLSIKQPRTHPSNPGPSHTLALPSHPSQSVPDPFNPLNLPFLPSSGQWYHSQVSKLRLGEESMLRRLGTIPRSWDLIIPGPEHRAHLPPLGYLTFFKAQLQSGLRFPIPLFYQDVARHYRVPIGQLQPNSFRHMAATYVLFQSLDLLISPAVFYLYYSCKFKDGTFIISSRPRCKFLINIPTSHKHWKEHFFYLRLPKLPNCPTSWLPGLLLQPEFLPSYHQSSFFLNSQKGLGGKEYDARTLLHEDFLVKHGLSSRNVTSGEETADPGHRDSPGALPG